MTSRKNAPRGACPRPPRRNPLGDCPLTAAFAAVGGKWKLTLVYWLSRGELHFAALQRRAAPVSHKVLTEQLRELEADGIVARTPSGAAPAPVLYRLTAYGETLLPMVEAVRVWGVRHLQRTRAAGVPGSEFESAPASQSGLRSGSQSGLQSQSAPACAAPIASVAARRAARATASVAS